MRLRAALSWISLLSCLLLACENADTPRASEPGPAQPSEPAPTPAPAPAPTPTPASEVSAAEPLLDLPAIAGIHYLEVVTGGADADAELPMIIALHGNGAYPALMAQATLELPGTNKHPASPYDAPARFIFLRGTEPVGAPGHARWFSVTAKDARKNSKRAAMLAEQIEARSHAVAAAIEALVQTRPTTGKPIVTGHSQGGILTFGLLLFHPELFAAAYPMAGWLPKPLWPKQPPSAAGMRLRVVALHGSADTTVDFSSARTMISQLDGLGWSIELHEYPGVKHTLSPMLAELRARLRETAGEQLRSNARAGG